MKPGSGEESLRLFCVCFWLPLGRLSTLFDISPQNTSFFFVIVLRLRTFLIIITRMYPLETKKKGFCVFFVFFFVCVLCCLFVFSRICDFLVAC